MLGKHERVAVVTGGAGGIGAVLVERLARRGHTAVVVDHDSKALALRSELLSARGLSAEMRRADVAKPDEAAAVLADVLERYGRIDILVNNVGGNTTPTPVEQLGDDELHRIMAVNFYSMVTCTRAVVGAMKRHRWGRIVNSSSIAGRTRTHFSNAAYTAAKAAVLGFTRQCAAELAPYGIAVNAVAHGAIATERICAAWEQKPAEQRAHILGMTPSGRLGTVDEAAAALEFLCGDDAGYMAGAVLDVNGGLYIG